MWKKDSNSEIPVKYTKLNLKTDSIRKLAASTQCLVNFDAVRAGNKVFAIYNGIWQVDLDTGKEELLFQHGVGPNQIYYPNNLLHFNGRIYAKSGMASKYLFHFSPAEAELKQLTTLAFNGKDSFDFDDYAFTSESILVSAYPYWKDELIRRFDFGKKKYTKRIGAPTVIPLMKKFNINAAYVCALNEKVYVAESIKPEVKIVSSKTFEIIDSLKLSPPFYVPLSSIKEARADKYNSATDRIWMAKWTIIRNLIAADQWLLVKYHWGFERRYNYELINLKAPHQRYYIDESPYFIFHMEIKDNHAVFTASEEREDKLAWLQLDVELK